MAVSAASELPTSALAEGNPGPGHAEYQVVDEPNANELAGVGETASKDEILGAGRRVAARVGMEENQAGRAREQAML